MKTFLTSCLVLTLTACSPDVKTVPLNVKAENPDRFICERVNPETDRPTLPPQYVIDWGSVVSVEQAKQEFEVFAVRNRERNQRVGQYVRSLEGVNFVCWNNMNWQNDYYDDLEGSLPR